MAASETTPLLEARGLGRTFGELWALRDLELRLERGERLAVFGPNGAGKTTLIQLFATLLKPTTGLLRIAGLDPARHGPSVRRLLGVMSHQTYLYPDLSASENLRFYGRLFAVPDLENRLAEELQRVSLVSQARSRTRALSRGMQQRLSLARALLHRPLLLLLDEPDTGLDEEGIHLLERVLAEAAAQGRSAIFTTHSIERGLAWSDRAIVLSRGRLVLDRPSAGLPPTAVRAAFHGLAELADGGAALSLPSIRRPS